MTRKQNFFGQISAATDVAVLSIAYLIAYSIRLRMWWYGYPVLPINSAGANAWVMSIALPAWLIAFRYLGLYKPTTYRSAGNLILTTLKGHLLGALIMLNTIFVMRGFGGASRMLLALIIAIAGVGLLGEKLALMCLIRHGWRLRRPSTVWRVLLVGSRSDAENYLELLGAHPEWNLEIVDIISTTREEIVPDANGDLHPTIQH